MQVLKFGGTSVGSIENMIAVRHIIDTPQPKIVVLSAMSGTTNVLVTLAQSIADKDTFKFEVQLRELRTRYASVVIDLYTNSETRTTVQDYVDQVFDEISELSTGRHSVAVADKIVAQGELLSTFIFTHFLQQEGVRAQQLPALDFMRIDKDGEPDMFYINQQLERNIAQSEVADVFITQGFICRDYTGKVSNLQRGGSDYTATIIGAAIAASEVQIWTDIDGFHNNDPRFVAHTTAIPSLSYDEAAELAYFGAKILHPQTVMPLRDKEIPLRLKNTMHPQASGTVITQQGTGSGIKAIAAKDGITAIKIKSGRMLQAYGFLRNVFEIFERYETPIDMITTSEIAVSLTIDNAGELLHILNDLEPFAQVTIDRDQSIICLVGHAINKDKETHRLFQILKDVDVRMISYGGSNTNISLLVKTVDKKETLRLLQGYVFDGVVEA